MYITYNTTHNTRTHGAQARRLGEFFFYFFPGAGQATRRTCFLNTFLGVCGHH